MDCNWFRHVTESEVLNFLVVETHIVVYDFDVLWARYSLLIGPVCFVADCYQAAVNWLVSCIIAVSGKWIDLSSLHGVCRHLSRYMFVYVRVHVLTVGTNVCVHVYDWICLCSGNGKIHLYKCNCLSRWMPRNQSTWFSNKLQVYSAFKFFLTWFVCYNVLVISWMCIPNKMIRDVDFVMHWQNHCL